MELLLLGAPPPPPPPASFYGNLKLKKVTWKGKKSKGFCCHTCESNSGPPAQKAAYQPTVLFIPLVNRFLGSCHPSTPPRQQCCGQKSTHFHPWCPKFNFVWGGREGVASLTNTTGKVPSLLTSTARLIENNLSPNYLLHVCSCPRLTLWRVLSFASHTL